MLSDKTELKKALLEDLRNEEMQYDGGAAD